jgi:hypothetical protein
MLPKQSPLALSFLRLVMLRLYHSPLWLIVQGISDWVSWPSASDSIMFIAVGVRIPPSVSNQALNIEAKKRIYSLFPSVSASLLID